MKTLIFISAFFFQTIVYGQIDAAFEPINVTGITKETVYAKFKPFEKKKLYFIKHYNTEGKVMKFEQFLKRIDTPENVTNYYFNSIGQVTSQLRFLYYKNQYIVMDSFYYTYNNTLLQSIRHYSDSTLKGKLINSYNGSYKFSEYWYYFNDTTQIQIHLRETFNSANKPIKLIRDHGDTTYYFYDILGRDSFRYQTLNNDTHEIRKFTYSYNKSMEFIIGKTFPEWTNSTMIKINSSGKKTKELCKFKYSKAGHKNIYKYNQQDLLISETNKNWNPKYKEQNFKWTFYHFYD